MAQFAPKSPKRDINRSIVHSSTSGFRPHASFVTGNDEYRLITERQEKLSGFLASAYEDKMVVDLDDDTFTILSAQFRKEHENNYECCQNIQKQILRKQHIPAGIELFKEAIFEIRHVDPLTREILHKILDRIEVYPMDKATKTQSSKIHYLFVWCLDSVIGSSNVFAVP